MDPLDGIMNRIAAINSITQLNKLFNWSLFFCVSALLFFSFFPQSSDAMLLVAMMVALVDFWRRVLMDDLYQKTMTGKE